MDTPGRRRVQPAGAAPPEDRGAPLFQAALHAATPRVWATAALVLANIGVFVALVFSGANPVSPSGEILLAWGANFAPLTASGEWWRLMAATFLHHGVFHLAPNMWALWDAGRLVERLYGNLSFLLIYLAAGVSGSLASALWHPQGAIAVGASGAVFGVLGALLAYMLREHRSVPRPVLMSLRASVLSFVGFSLIVGFLQTGIDNASHLGGLGCGLLLGALLARPLFSAQRTQMLARRLPVALAAGAVLIGGLVWLVPPPAYDYRLERQMQAEVVRFGAEEEAILAEWKKVAEERGAIGDRGVGERLHGLARRWGQAAEGLARLSVSEASPSRQRLELLRRYAELRRDSAQLVAEALMEQDPEKMDRARAITGEMEKVREAIERNAAKAKGKGD